MRVLAGDIGGTKTAIATVDIDRDDCRVRRLVRYPSADYPGLEEIVAEFLAGEKTRPRAAGFGVAGPVREGVAKVTKLPWRLDVRTLSRRARIPRVALVNDFQAAAAGIHYLRSRQLATLVPGRGERGATVAILGAGTGLGQAGIVRRGGRAVVVASEGGHVDFGPRSAAEDGLVDFLRRRFGRATRDRILSGGGLALIYEYLKSTRAARENAAVAAAFRSEDHAAVISRFALARSDRLCRLALDMFVSIYGSEAGNIALQYRATGGVYVGGGIAPRVLPALKTERFRRAFGEKAPMEDLLAQIPVRAVIDWRLGLFGAAASVIE
ncbi:MAG TPA: glucokinase [Thermoanaerobaculia bacterium]|nr:glucokinase [Thermoanaerobaculia bacterium]